MALPVHAETGVKNLEVWMLLRSLRDKKLVDLVFSWQYYYYYLKAEGVKYVRDKLGTSKSSILKALLKMLFQPLSKKLIKSSKMMFLNKEEVQEETSLLAEVAIEDQEEQKKEPKQHNNNNEIDI